MQFTLTDNVDRLTILKYILRYKFIKLFKLDCSKNIF